MSDELKDQRIPIMMTPSEVKAIDDWMFANRIKSRAEAIRRLCQQGIALDDLIEELSQVYGDHIRSGKELSDYIKNHQGKKTFDVVHFYELLRDFSREQTDYVIRYYPIWKKILAARNTYKSEMELPEYTFESVQNTRDYISQASIPSFKK